MNIAKLYKVSSEHGHVRFPDANALRRARRAYAKNKANPGDCGNDDTLLAGLAVAQAEVGIGPGWIPEVQRIGCNIARIAETLALESGKTLPLTPKLWRGIKRKAWKRFDGSLELFNACWRKYRRDCEDPLDISDVTNWIEAFASEMVNDPDSRFYIYG